MSGLEPLVPLIYHEKQQPGSQLCAQHALNVILQGDFFSAPDLAQFAQQLDTLEGSFNDDAGPVSNNMDDTGFFSVQVLERALRVWGYKLVRWRSQELRDHQEAPHAQMAFLLNHEQHWFSLRRFGSLEDPDNGHWFNLNSFLEQPEWVGRLYLALVLSQAEDEGYSVFAVLPTRETPGGPTTLPRTEADEVASTLAQPTSASPAAYVSTPRVSRVSSSTASPHVPGLEGEDLELQAALQASLMGGQGEIEYAALAGRQPALPTPQTSSTMDFIAPSRRAELSGGSLADVNDPVAASMARNKAIMQRMLREQEMALREGYDEDVASSFGASRSAPLYTSSESLRSRQTPRLQTEGEREEEEAIHKAIEESRREEDHEGSMDTSDGDYVTARTSGSDGGGDEVLCPPQREPLRQTPSAFSNLADRVYDDEDSELQAALKASLEAMPEGFLIPPTPPRAVRADTEQAPHSITQPEMPTCTKENREEEEAKAVEEIDANELRRRRLARFGGQS